MAKITNDDLKRAGINPAESDEVSFEEIDSFGNKESFREMVGGIKNYMDIVNQRITLINDSLTSAIPFTRESLYLFCALSGNGKSTIAANISYPLWRQKKKILVISNEETDQDICMRIACLHLGYDFNAYKKGDRQKMTDEMLLECISLFPDITTYVKIKDVKWKDGGTTRIEGVKALLEAVKGQGYSAVLIDYYQLIKDSRNKSQTRYDVLNDLRIWLGRYIKKCDLPVVLFAQLYSLGKKGGVKDIDARIKECSAVVEPATVIIEAIPNIELKATDFIIHKDRFGIMGTKIICPFDKGRFYNQLEPHELEQRKLAIKAAKAEKDLDDLVSIPKEAIPKEATPPESVEQHESADFLAGQSVKGNLKLK